MPDLRQVESAMSTFINPNLSKIHRCAAYHAVVGAWSSPVLLGCSGGIDSTALLLLAAKATMSGKVGPFIAVHVNHLTRSEIEDERTFLSRLCASIKVPFVSLRIPVSSHAGEKASEALLRQQRYGCFATLARKTAIRQVVVAHTRDDQIETILMRLLSGAAPVAASGMKQKTELETDDGNISVFRPLLTVSRLELEQALKTAGIQAMDDVSNADRTYRRNALRHDIIPRLYDIYPGFDQALVRAVSLAARDASYLDVQAAAVLADESPVTMRHDEVVVDRTFVAGGSPAIVSRILRSVLIELLDGRHEKTREITFERVESLRLAAAGRTGTVIQMPGDMDVFVDRTSLRFVNKCKDEH